MTEMNINQFCSKLFQNRNIKISDYEPLRIIQEGGEDFIIISAKEWERRNETLYILENSSLMKQIEKSLKTHREGKGYIPTEEELYEGNSI